MTDDLDDRKSRSIPFLAISDQYANLDLFFGKFVKKWQPARYTTLFLYFFSKMAAGGHFGSPIFAQNNTVLPLCVINGYAKYEVDR